MMNDLLLVEENKYIFKPEYIGPSIGSGCNTDEACSLKEKLLSEELIEDTSETIIAKMIFDSNMINTYQESIKNYFSIIGDIKERIEILDERNRSNFELLKKLDNGGK